MNCRLFFILIFFPLSVAAQHNTAIEEYRGWKLNGGYDWATDTTDLNTADGGDADSCSDTIIAISINPAEDCTIDKFRIYLNTLTGSLGSNDLVAAIQATSSGAPSGTDINSYNTLTSAASGGAMIEWAGFNDVVSQNTQSWILVKNCNGTPGTNYPRFRTNNPGLHQDRTILAEGETGNSYRLSTNGGSTWTAATTPSKVLDWVVECAEGYSMGFPVTGFYVATGGSSRRAYNTTETGAIFTTPADAKLNAIGIIASVVKIGTPTGGMRYKLYQGTTLIATTDTMAVSSVSTTNVHRRIYFDTTQTLEANTSYRIVVSSAGAGDSSSNSYGISTALFENDAESLTLRPFGGTFKQTEYNGSSWSETEINVPAIAIILDNSDYYGTASGGTGGKKSTFNRGLN